MPDEIDEPARTRTGWSPRGAASPDGAVRTARERAVRSGGVSKNRTVIAVIAVVAFFVLVAVAVVIAPSLLGPSVPQSPSASGPLLADSFSRQFSGGWGTPDSGPAWVAAGGAAEAASVDGNSGQLSISTAPGSQFERVSLVAADLDISARFSLDALPAGVPVTIHFWPRTVDAGNQYRFYVTLTPAGDLFGTFSAVVDGTGSALGQATRLGSAYSAGSWWHLRVQASGSGPTSLRARAWLDGTPEPQTWALELTDSTASLQAPSQAVQLGIYAAAGETQLPLHVAFDDVQITAATP
ncbi:MAG: hypothetical protein ABI452_01405 [Candidatus Limnocylindrales bacterium]